MGNAIPQFLNAAIVLGLLNVPRVANPPGDRDALGVGRAVPVRGAGSVTPFFTKHALWAVVKFAKRPPLRPVGVVGSLVIFGLALAKALAVGLGVAFAAAKEAGAEPKTATATEREMKEIVRILA